ncbi:hypothetical protein AL755_10090 [Arthrobacter sp. ERGS1:01]|uniref:hypothetical protein n=1 Tax=Arthrobacter sp. ERGS1:01 TaxID=1704044 RepID=UPI0006B5C1A8|nr:hypothetical protein [Arthrobacter sp. ERGS1:01]ALE05736.1 hypothetical protein AL755_10090 [Arthrobacter sp. ERGS1:01]
MNKVKFAVRCTAVTTGVVLLAGVAGMAMAEENHGHNDVDVSVGISKLDVPGVLAMSVAGTTAALTENGSTGTVRQFTGKLPTVTVTDTRSAADIPAGAGWYVLGTSSDFTGSAGQDPISASHLGWSPQIIDGGAAGLVAGGDQVDTVMDSGPNAVGLVDQELLALAFDSGTIASEGQWTASANLFLRTPATVAPGDYTAKLTLSLFE